MGFLKGFSWRRATGLSYSKARISRSIGIPLTRSGRTWKKHSILWSIFFGTKKRRRR